MKNSEKTILIFPQSKRIAKIKRVAEVIVSKQTMKAKNSYWRVIKTDLDRKLTELGLSQEDVFAEVNSFSNEVQKELNRLQRTEHCNTTGDAS